jgi:3-mercaptopyruvate sulfurtransferase SseA
LPRDSNRSIFPILLIAGGVLVLITTGVLIFNPELLGGANTTQGNTQEIYPQVERLSLAQSKEAFDANAAVFVDVRDPTYYQAGHIPGAISIPLNEIEKRFLELRTDQWIILYCT